jgi:hypothetical protein
MKNTVQQVFDNLSLKYRLIREEDEAIVYNLGIGLEHSKVDCFVDIRPVEEILLIYVVSMMKVPELRRRQMAEYITRANYNLKLGNFELDFKDGELRYKCTLLYDSTFPQSDAIVGKNFMAAVNTMERYLAGAMAVSFGNIDPKIACSLAEDDKDPALN